MFKIGEFARMGQVSVRTLRHYEEIGLLKPDEIDRFSGYRYYSTRQLPRLNRILTLKDLGFSLEQIGALLDGELTATRLNEMLREKHSEVSRQLQETRALLARLETWIKTGENEMETSAYEITFKQVEPLLVASLRRHVPAYANLAIPFGELRDYLARCGAGHKYPSIILWRFSGSETGEEEQEFEVEICERLDEPVPETGQVRVYTLPGLELAASVIHRGDLALAFQAYQALASRVEEQGYRVSGPTRQIHLSFNPRNDPETFVTEFQIPLQ